MENIIIAVLCLMAGFGVSYLRSIAESLERIADKLEEK